MQSRLPYNATLSRRTQDLNTILSRNSMVSSALLRQAVGVGACSGTPREMQFERLHHLGTRLRSRVGFRSIVAEALLTTVSVAQADAGILQLYDCESASLQLLAQYGVEYPAVQAIEFLSGNAAVAIFADEEARRSIARDLHDDIGQRAALIAMNLQSLCRSLCNESDPSDPTSAQLASVTRDVDALGGRLRELSHQLHPMIVGHLGLAHAVRSLVQDFNRGYQMKATIQSDKPKVSRYRLPRRSTVSLRRLFPMQLSMREQPISLLPCRRRPAKCIWSFAITDPGSSPRSSMAVVWAL